MNCHRDGDVLPGAVADLPLFAGIQGSRVHGTLITQDCRLPDDGFP